jgi:hypothetical protein
MSVTSISYWRRSGFAIAVLSVTLTAQPGFASAQSLGDVARREQERRKETAPSGRVYTNDALQPVDPVAAEPAAQAGATAASDPAPKTETPGYVLEEDLGAGVASIKSTTPPRQKRDEQYWRKLFTDVRARVAKANAAVAAQEARLAAIQADQSPTAVREREVLAAEIVRLQRGARLQADDLARWLARANDDKVPAEWTR